MRYLKPKGPNLELTVVKKIEGNEHKEKKIFNLLFTLDVIDEIQDKTGLPIDEVIHSVTDTKTKEAAVKCLLIYITGEKIEIEKNKLDYYSILLLNAYIDQLLPKEFYSVKEKDDNSFHFYDVEHWFYIGKYVLGYSDDEVWSMTPGKISTLFREHAKYNGWVKEESEAKKENVIAF